MSDFISKDYKVFELFRNKWALATAGTPDDYNSCTIGWGSLGTLWTRKGKSGAIVTVYLHPDRYTCEFFRKNDSFTVSFFPDGYRKALGYMGSHSGRDGDKAAACGLTPKAMSAGESVSSVTFEEAGLTFLCRKLYQHSFAKEDLAEEIQEYYKLAPKDYPPDENGEWQPHWVFVGEIVAAEGDSSNVQ